MQQVFLITQSKSLVEFCRRLLPQGFSLHATRECKLKTETGQIILLFDSQSLAEKSDAIIAEVAERFRAEEGGISISVLVNEEHRSQAFSLFPENMRHVQSLLHYRIVNNKIEGFSKEEFRWLLESQNRFLHSNWEKILTQNENKLLADRLTRLEAQRKSENRYPAFMQGRSHTITHFREQVLKTFFAVPYLLLSGKDHPPLEDFVEYYAMLLSPEKSIHYEIIDAATLPASLQAQAIWPLKKKSRATKETATIRVIQNIQNLGWANQARLLQELHSFCDSQAQGSPPLNRYIFTASPDILTLVRREKFRQELYSLLRKGMVAVPGLYERPRDITHIASEFIARRNFAPLGEEKALIAARILEKFDLSTGYRGLYMMLELMHDWQKSKGLPVFELLTSVDKSDAFLAAQNFLRSEISPNVESLFQNLATSQKDLLSLDSVEQNYITAVLDRYGGQITETARHLGISRKTLYDKMRRYKLARRIKNKDAATKVS